MTTEISRRIANNPYFFLDDDENTIRSVLDSHGNIRVVQENRTTTPLDTYFVQPKGPPTFLTAATAIDDVTIDVVSVANVLIGDYVGIFSVISDRFYFATVLDVTSLTLTLDTPFDFTFQIGDSVIITKRNLGVDGSVTPQTFVVNGSNTSSVVIFDITRIMIQMLTDTAVDLGKFGDLTALTNGLVLRKTDGVTNNIWNVKTNGDFANLAYDFTTYAATNPAQGVNGIAVRYTFTGPDKHGTAIRLAQNDSLELIVQDDLSDIIDFKVIAQGHIVDV